MWNTEVQNVKAKKAHRCTSCGEQIKPGEMYKKWVSFDGGAFTNKMHQECLDMHNDGEYGEWEYMPYSYERPAP